jgi:hypothetical protein
MKGAIRWGPNDMKVQTTEIFKDGKLVKTFVTYLDTGAIPVLQKVIEPLGYTVTG